MPDNLKHRPSNKIKKNSFTSSTSMGMCPTHQFPDPRMAIFLRPDMILKKQRTRLLTQSTLEPEPPNQPLLSTTTCMYIICMYITLGGVNKPRHWKWRFRYLILLHSATMMFFFIIIFFFFVFFFDAT